MRPQIAWLTVTLIFACCCGAAAGEVGQADARNDQEQSWHTIFHDEQLTIDVERSLYERPGRESFLVQIRVKNRTTREIGLALDYATCIHPNQWGFQASEQRGIVDESRMIPIDLSSTRRAQLIKAFAEGRLISIRPGQSATYFRQFNGSAGNSGRQAVEKQSQPDAFLIVSLDGQLFYTDGQLVQSASCQWQDNYGPENSDLVLKQPIRWQKIPPTARVIEDSAPQ